MNDQRLYILGRDWQLRGYGDGTEMAYNWVAGTKRFMSGTLLTVARMCDGKTDFASPAIPTLFRRLAALLAEEGIAEPCEAGRSLLEGQVYRRAKNVYIASLLFSITNRCNFRCLHCYVDAPAGRYGELSRESLELLLDQFAQANVPNVALTGGEPFIRPDLQDFLFGLRDRRIGFSEVFTNAALLTGEILDKVEEAGFRPSFKVSFDCVGSHDHMRGVPGAEESTLRGIRLLIRRGYSVTIITTIDNLVIQNLGATLTLLAGMGVHSWRMAPPIEIGAWRGAQSKVELDGLVAAFKDVLRRWNEMGRPFKLALWKFGEFHPDGSAYSGPARKFTDESFDCPNTHAIPYVKPDGVVVPCASFTENALLDQMPNLLETPLCEAWNSPVLRRIGDLKKGEVRAYNPTCRACGYFDVCGSGCRAVAMLAQNDFMRRDPTACLLQRGGYFDDFYAFASALDGVRE